MLRNSASSKGSTSVGLHLALEALLVDLAVAGQADRDLVSSRTTKEPLAPYGGTSPAMNEVIGACKKGGLFPFANFNRIHMVPPCNISDEDAKEGLAALDAALSVGDAHADH